MGRDYETHVIPRSYSNGLVILGGYMQKGNGEFHLLVRTESILKCTKGPSSEVTEGTKEVIAAFSGLRPSREGGARVEREDVNVAGQMRAIIHKYGAGGAGLQAGHGMAVEAANAAGPLLLEMVLKNVKFNWA